MKSSGTAVKVSRIAAGTRVLTRAVDSPTVAFHTGRALESRNGVPNATAHSRDSIRAVPAVHTPVRLHDVLEEEAKRMAQSLHDEAGQLLATVHLKLDELSGMVSEGHRNCVLELKSLLDQMEMELRRISHELRPMILDDFGLLPAVEFLTQGVAKRTGLSIVLEGSTRGRIHPALETALYRIVHEALGNIARHARAKHVRIAFRKDDQIECMVHDDGIGFDPAEMGLGLSAIRERVEDLSGVLSIHSGPEFGTTLLVSIPLSQYPYTATL